MSNRSVEIFTCTVLAALLLLALCFHPHRPFWSQPKLCYVHRTRTCDAVTEHSDGQVYAHKKPPWVLIEVLRLKALMGRHAGYRKIAHTFNRLYAPHSMGKTFVAEAIKNHQYLVWMPPGNR